MELKKNPQARAQIGLSLNMGKLTVSHLLWARKLWRVVCRQKVARLEKARESHVVHAKLDETYEPRCRLAIGSAWALLALNRPNSRNLGSPQADKRTSGQADKRLLQKYQMGKQDCDLRDM
jgi:hypothetical protein